MSAWSVVIGFALWAFVLEPFVEWLRARSDNRNREDPGRYADHNS